MGFTDENVSIDFITSENGIVVHEVKLSKALEEAHIFQVKYYLLRTRMSFLSSQKSRLPQNFSSS